MGAHSGSGVGQVRLVRQRGFLLMAAVVLIVIAALLLSVMVFFSISAHETTVRHQTSKQSLFIADTGVERALRGLLQEGTACNALTYTSNFATGNFSTRGTLYTPAASTLSANIGAADTVVPLASTAGYAPFGRVRIQAEEINYADLGTTPAACAPFAQPCLTSAQRGVDGTTPAPHALGTSVTQNQCVINSVGTAGAASRTVQAAVRPGAAIARADASNSVGPNGPTGTLIWNHIVSGNDRLLIVGISLRGNVAVSSVTYGGTPLTAVAGGVATQGNNVRTELWYLLAPATGTNTIIATLSANTRAVGGSISLTGVDQTTPLELPAANNSGACFFCAPTASVNLTTTTDNAWIVDVLGWRLTTGVANVGGLGRVQQWNLTTGGGWQNGVGGAGASTDNAPVTPPGTVTVDWTLGAAFFHTWAISAVAVRPAGGGGVLFWRESFQ